MSDTLPSLAIVDDHELVADAIATAINLRGSAVATVVDAGDVVDRAPDLVLLDLRLGDRSGLDLVAPLVAAGVRVVLLTASPDHPAAVAAMAAGAVGVLDKASPFSSLVDAVGDHLGLDAAPAALDALTPTERSVLEELADGRNVTRIAESRGVAVTTVRTQVRALLSKLGVHSQLQAVAVLRGAGAN